jgi:hypothetical protein
MEFTIQCFAKYDQMLGMESVEASHLDEVLDRARSILKKLDIAPRSPEDPELIGYVILDDRGRQVARGYRR